MTSEVDVSIVIPAYNESENLAETAERIAAIFAERPEKWEIIFVNDGSTDNTWEAAKRLSSVDGRIVAAGYRQNRGRGYALRHGFARARGKFIVSTDADLSYAPHFILDLLDALYNDPQTDFVLGSPYMPGGGTEGVDPKRLFISKLGNIILRRIINNEIYTWTGVFRAYRREALDSIILESDDKEIHLEILSRALGAGFQVKEIPAVLASRRKGQSKFRFRGTAISHLIFSVYERPIILFGGLGFFLLLAGFIGGLYVTFLRFAGTLNPERPLITLVVILILAGMQILSFGFIALQMGVLRQELLKLQRETRQIQQMKHDE